MHRTIRFGINGHVCVAVSHTCVCCPGADACVFLCAFRVFSERFARSAWHAAGCDNRETEAEHCINELFRANITRVFLYRNGGGTRSCEYRCGGQFDEKV